MDWSELSQEAIIDIILYSIAEFRSGAQCRKAIFKQGLRI